MTSGGTEFIIHNFCGIHAAWTEKKESKEARELTSISRNFYSPRTEACVKISNSNAVSLTNLIAGWALIESDSKLLFDCFSMDFGCFGPLSKCEYLVIKRFSTCPSSPGLKQVLRNEYHRFFNGCLNFLQKLHGKQYWTKMS